MSDSDHEEKPRHDSAGAAGDDTRRFSPVWGTRRKGEAVPPPAALSQDDDGACDEPHKVTDLREQNTSPVDVRSQGVTETVPIPGRLAELVNRQPGGDGSDLAPSPLAEGAPGDSLSQGTSSASGAPAVTPAADNSESDDLPDISTPDDCVPDDCAPDRQVEAGLDHESDSSVSDPQSDLATVAPSRRTPLTKRLGHGIRTLLDPFAGTNPGATSDVDSDRDSSEPTTPMAGQDQQGDNPPTGSDKTALDRIWHDAQRELDQGYTLQPDPIGSGAQGEIYRLVHVEDKPDLVLKVLKQPHSPDQLMVLKSLTGKKLGHLSNVIAVGRLGERAWELQDWCPGISLHTLLRGRQKKLTAAQLLILVDALTDALEALHNLNIVHRDLKPGNILCSEEIDGPVHLVDFGVSAVVLPGQERYVHAGSTEPYMSPEMFSYISQPAADWWALGILAFEALTGRHPFADSASPGGFMPGVSIAAWLNAHDVDVSEISDPRWQLLVRGLLTREFTHRWGAEQVRAWREGQTPDVYLGRDTVGLSVPLQLTFDAEEFDQARDWAAALAAQWDVALIELKHQATSWAAAFRRANTGAEFVDVLHMVADGTMSPARALVELQGRARLPIVINTVPVSTPRQIDNLLNQIERDPKSSKPGSTRARAWLNTVASEGLLSAAAPYLPKGDPWRLAASRLSAQCGLIRDRLGQLPTDVSGTAGPVSDEAIVERAFRGLVNTAKSTVQRSEAIKLIDALPKDVDIPPAVLALRAEINDRTSPAAGQAAAAALLLAASAWARTATNQSDDARKAQAGQRKQHLLAGRAQRKPLARRRAFGWGMLMAMLAALVVLPELARGRLDVPAVAVVLVLPIVGAAVGLYLVTLLMPHSDDALVRRVTLVAGFVSAWRFLFDGFNADNPVLVWMGVDLVAATGLAALVAAGLGSATAKVWHRRVAKRPPQVAADGSIGRPVPLPLAWPPLMVWFLFVGTQFFNWDFDSDWAFRQLIQDLDRFDNSGQVRLNLPDVPDALFALGVIGGCVVWLVWDYLPRVNSWLPHVGRAVAGVCCLLSVCAHPFTTACSFAVLWMTTWMVSVRPKAPQPILESDSSQVSSEHAAA